MLREVALIHLQDGKKVWNRGNMYNQQQVEQLGQSVPPVEFHMSVLSYKTEEMTLANAVLEEIWLDIDRDENIAPIESILQVRSIAYQKYLSTRGCHILLANAWDFTADELENKIVYSTLYDMFGTLVDLNPYAHVRGMIRGIGSLNSDRELCKVLVSSFKPTDPQVTLVKHKPKEVEPSKEVSFEGDKFACIRKLLSEPLSYYTIENSGPGRHNVLLRVVSHYKQQLMTLPNAKDIAWDVITTWNDGTYQDSKLLQDFEYIWKKGYHYGCSDPILADLCSKECPFVKKIQPQGSMRERAQHFIKHIFPFGIPLKKAFPSIPPKFRLFPGHIVTIAGPPATFKTTIAMYLAIMLGEKTLFLANDESDVEIYMRALGQTTGLSQDEVFKLMSTDPGIGKELDHITFRECRDPEQIKAMLNTEKPRLLIVDHAELVDTPTDGYKAIRDRTMFFKSLSEYRDKCKLTVIVISHVLRSAARTKEVNMHTLKGHELEREGDAVIHTIRMDNNDSSKSRIRFYSEEKHRNNPGFDVILDINHTNFKPEAIVEDELRLLRS